jgi:hypothetical protein
MNNPQPWWLTWPPAEVAAAILPLLANAPCSPCDSKQSVLEHIVKWCKTGSWGQLGWMRDAPRIRALYEDTDFRAVAEAIQVLEHAGLVMESVWGSHDVTSEALGLTRLGRHVLQTNTVRQHLGLGDAPSTA